MAQITVRRIVGTILVGGVAIYFASEGGLIGLVAVVVTYVVAAASVVLGPAAWVGQPGKLPPRYGVAAAGSAFGLILAGAAAALGVPALGHVVAGVMSAFIAGVLLGLVLIRFPDEHGRRP